MKKERKNYPLSLSILGIEFVTRSLHSTPFQNPRGGRGRTDITTYRLQSWTLHTNLDWGGKGEIWHCGEGFSLGT